MIKNCHMRHKNGNCLPAGGFCTANKNICEALHNAYELGRKSAQPRAGHWIEHKWAEEANEMLISNYECSECHYWERYDSNFCPNCGADMRGESDD